MPVTVEGWFREVHHGADCHYVCIQYEHFGFALAQDEVEAMIRKLASLLHDDVCDVDEQSDLHVDWSQADSDWVMIAFRPSENCQGRFYDIPKSVAAELLAKLEQVRRGSEKATKPVTKTESAD